MKLIENMQRCFSSLQKTAMRRRLDVWMRKDSFVLQRFDRFSWPAFITNRFSVDHVVIVVLRSMIICQILCKLFLTVLLLLQNNDNAMRSSILLRKCLPSHAFNNGILLHYLLFGAWQKILSVTSFECWENDYKKIYLWYSEIEVTKLKILPKIVLKFLLVFVILTLEMSQYHL